MDTDEMIAKDVGMLVPDIIRKRGEPAFRDVERKAVQLVSFLDKTVISTGGGVPLDESNRAALEKNGIVVWLKVSPSTVLQRMGPLKNRPLIDAANPLESIEKRLSEESRFMRLRVTPSTPTVARWTVSSMRLARLVSMGVCVIRFRKFKRAFVSHLHRIAEKRF